MSTTMQVYVVDIGAPFGAAWVSRGPAAPQSGLRGRWAYAPGAVAGNAGANTKATVPGSWTVKPCSGSVAW